MYCIDDTLVSVIVTLTVDNPLFRANVNTSVPSVAKSLDIVYVKLAEFHITTNEPVRLALEISAEVTPVIV